MRSSRALAPLAALAALALPGCRFLIDGRVGSRYTGEYPAWLPHVSFIGFFVLVADVWACVECWRSKNRGFVGKVIWSLLIFFFPLGGFILFFLFGYEG